MPEGDTVFQAATRLRRGLAGHTLTYCQFRIPQLATVDLSGRTVTAVRSVGKHLLIDLGPSTPDSDDTLSIHSHLKMEGTWHVHRLGTRWRRPTHHARIVLRTATVEAVGFELGILELLDDPDAALAYLGPDLLAAEFDRDTAIARISADPDRTVGEALLDQRLMAGVGNVYRSELCFLRGALPTRPVGDVDIPGLVDLSRRVLWANRERTVRVTTGNTARGAELWVYGRNQKPCRRCNSPVERSFLGSTGDDRVIYVCRRCQT